MESGAVPKGETLAATNFVRIGTPETDFPRVSVVYATCGAHHEAQHDAASLRYIEWTALSYSPD
jgi:hypothetical protein